MEHIYNINEAHWVPKWIWIRVPILSGYESEALAGNLSLHLYGLGAASAPRKLGDRLATGPAQLGLYVASGFLRIPVLAHVNTVPYASLAKGVFIYIRKSEVL